MSVKVKTSGKVVGILILLVALFAAIDTGCF